MLFTDDIRIEGGDREQRRQISRCCGSLLLILIFMFLIRMHQEKYEENNKARKKHIPTIQIPWEAGSFVSKSKSLLSSVYIHPNFVILPSLFSTKDNYVSAGYLTSSKDFKNDHSSKFSSFLYVKKCEKNKRLETDWFFGNFAGSEKNNDNKNKKYKEEVIGVIIDIHLHLQTRIPGCIAPKSEEKNSKCYLALVKFDLTFCLNNTDSLLSWTCSDYAHMYSSSSSSSFPSSSSSFSNLSSSPAYCVLLLSGRSMKSIYELSKKIREENSVRSYFSSSTSAAILHAFCGNPLNQFITLDISRKRIFFAQAIYDTKKYHLKESNETNTKNENFTRLLRRNASRMLKFSTENAKSMNFSSNCYKIKINDTDNGLTKTHCLYLPDSSSVETQENEHRNLFVSKEEEEEEALTEKHVFTPTGPVKLQDYLQRIKMIINSEPSFEFNTNGFGLNGTVVNLNKVHQLSTYCISSIYLDEFYTDISECVRIPLPPNLIRVPVYMQYDAYTSTIAIFNFDKDDNLVISILSSTPIYLKYSVKLLNFKSGWFIASEDVTNGKISILGDNHPYLGILHIIDIETATVKRVDIYKYPGSPLK